MENTEEEKAKKDVPEKVKAHQFGCRNCLWASIECKGGLMYKPGDNCVCDGYTYYD